ncbi:hypothetical protein XINFAN_03828 [Pseudogemmobacter humi]|uniref:Lipoprotein n=2 Tax=Pseudogemmobacter humi TaxID=2483812 RepID=A0A3P5XF95_9RHOB|nr:hypothetical protein XINFAN_03828 [Pseudogemmobacter humi]
MRKAILMLVGCLASGCTGPEQQAVLDTMNTLAQAMASTPNYTPSGTGSAGSPCDQAPGAGYICR